MRATVGFAAASFLFVGLAIAEQDVRDVFERARLLDENNQNLSEAIHLYTQVVEQADSQRALAARAQYRLGVLHERLGHRAEAQRAFRAVVSQYPDQIDVARKARARIVDEESPLIKKSGPSPEGAYPETFTVSSATNLMPAVDAARHRLYLMTCFYTTTAKEASRLIVIDTDANDVIRTIPMGMYIDHIAFNPANNKLYATAQVDRRVEVIDTVTFAQTAIAIPGLPTGIAANPITNTIYVSSQGFGGNDKLFAIDGNSAAVSAPHDLEGVAGDVFVNTATNRVYVFAPPKTRVFNGSDLSVLADLSDVGVVHTDSVRNRIYTRTGDAIQVLDGNTHDQIALLAVRSPNAVVASDPERDQVFVLIPERDQMALIDSVTNIERGRFVLARLPYAMAVDSGTGRVYVAHHSDPPLVGAFLARSVEGELPAEFAEEFDGPALDPSWNVVSGWGGYALGEGRLRFRIGKRSGSKSRSAMARRFCGDHWTLELKSSYSTGPSGGSRVLSFAVDLGVGPTPGAPAAANFVQVSRGRDDWNGCCLGEVAQLFFEQGRLVARTALPATATDSYVWRIRRDGRTISVERSDDGTIFTVVGAHTFGPQIDDVAERVTISFDSFADNDAYADYDYVRLRR